jgi:hypothetical protein
MIINGKFNTNPGNPVALSKALDILDNVTTASWIMLMGVATGNIYIGGPNTSKAFSANCVPHPVNTLVTLPPVGVSPYTYDLSQVLVDADGTGTVYFTAWTQG